jgi:hypothetical protein
MRGRADRGSLVGGRHHHHRQKRTDANECIVRLRSSLGSLRDEDYHIAFDVTRNGFQWMIPFLISMGAGIFLLLGWALRKSGDRDLSVKGVIFQGLSGIGVLGALGFLIAAYSTYHNASRALSDHDYSIAEGIVTDFIPMPAGGHAVESFRINGVNFSYGSGWGSTVFNSEWNKGAVHNGVQARISYRGSDILRVEVR